MRAVAAHAAGQYTLPERFVPTRFLVTVGFEDEPRVLPATDFVQAAKLLGIRARVAVILEHDHAVCQRQLDWSREFFIRVRRQPQ